MKKELLDKVFNYIREKLSEEICVIDYISHRELEEILLDINNNSYSAFNSVINILDEKGAFDNIEIIYYSKAMEYLSKNDSSLKESINIAIEYGYSLENINSELLATLLAQKEERESMYEYKDEFNELCQSVYKEHLETNLE